MHFNRHNISSYSYIYMEKSRCIKMNIEWIAYWFGYQWNSPNSMLKVLTLYTKIPVLWIQITLNITVWNVGNLIFNNFMQLYTVHWNELTVWPENQPTKNDMWKANWINIAKLFSSFPSNFRKWDIYIHFKIVCSAAENVIEESLSSKADEWTTFSISDWLLT